MKWEELVKTTRNLPAIDTENLIAGESSLESVKVQISRWRKAGRLIQIKRGIYLLAEPYRKIDIFEPYIASLLKKPSYISLEKALEYHNLIPEAVPVYTSVTTKRPGRFTSQIGVFDYRHIKTSLFWGYNSVTVNGQVAFIASAEKALLDFFYIKGVNISPGYLKELRLQNVEKISMKRLSEYAKKFKKPGMIKVADKIKEHIRNYKAKERAL